ncbi:hypothetical protein [Paenibacillus sp. V4I5]|uniref:hypothetical protein n=1 Tax=Paenibacillus sp. V4I5 TaxID=3042306 RepID=UPI002793A070|nr:hypothetical protein [Paenibacillus sp. V4I5]MDQ0914704.1 hypothetical protein [Paenibacillus sp. V4I5]
MYYLRHSADGLISLIVGLFVSKYLNGLWFTFWLKGREFDGLRHAYFIHIYMAAGLMVGLITGVGLKLKIGAAARTIGSRVKLSGRIVEFPSLINILNIKRWGSSK